MIKEQKFRSIWVIWGIFLLTPMLYDAILELVLLQGLKSPDLGTPLQLPALLMGASLVIATLALWRIGLNPKRLRQAGPSESAVVHRWTMIHILVYVLADSMSLQGMAVGVMLRSSHLANYFFVATVILVGLLYPRPRSLQDAIGGNFT